MIDPKVKEDVLQKVQNSEELLKTVKELIAAMQVCECQNFIRFNYALSDTKYELTFMKLPKVEKATT